MAYSTHYLGHIQVRPALNDAEFAYLTAFSETPHVVEDPHRYFVSDNPRAPRDVGEQGFRVFERRDDLPDVFCPWVPSCGGECLVVDDLDGQARDAAKWLQFLFDHFLRPGAHAARPPHADFAAFTFDHHLGAAVAAHRSDSGRLWLIRPQGHERHRGDRLVGRIRVVSPPPPSMVIGMATKKVTVTLDERQLARIRGLVDAGAATSVSGFVQHAVSVSLDDVAGWGAMLAEALRDSGGPLTKQERAWADRVLGGRPTRRGSAA